MKSIDPSQTAAEFQKWEAEIQENNNFRAQLLVRFKEHAPAMMKKGDRWKRMLKSLLDSQDKEYSQKELKILQTSLENPEECERIVDEFRKSPQSHEFRTPPSHSLAGCHRALQALVPAL